MTGVDAVRYIIAHQIVSKLNVNDYSTSMTGLKSKLAHKRADKETWSAGTRAPTKECSANSPADRRNVTPFRTVKRKAVGKQ